MTKCDEKSHMDNQESTCPREDGAQSAEGTSMRLDKAERQSNARRWVEHNMQL